jgi:MFS transporter, DHA3 family, macrolide efflux protein
MSNSSSSSPDGGTKANGRSNFSQLLSQRRGFLPLFVGDVVSTSGFAIFTASVNYLVYTETNSALSITYVGIASFLPTIIIGLFAGAFVDRSNKRRVMITCDLSRALIVSVIPIWMIFEGFNLGVIIAVTLAVNVFSTIFRPAARSLMPQIVQSKWIPDANGLMSASESLANSAALALGGALIVAVGASLSLFYNSVTYFVSAVMIFLILVPSSSSLRAEESSASKTAEVSVPSTADSKRKTSFIADVREGTTYMLQHKGILEMTLVASVMNFFLTMSLNFLVVYVTKFLLSGGIVYGSLLASFSLGSAIGALLIGRLNALRYAGKALIASNILSALSTLGLILLRNVLFAGAMEFILGFSLGLSTAIYFSVVQTLVPGNVLGRVISVDEVGSFASIPLAQIAGGLLIQTFGIAPDIEIAGFGLILTGIFSFFLKDLRNIKAAG